MTEIQIIEKKQRGDIAVVAKMLSTKLGRTISIDYAAKLICREKSKLHEDAIDALRKVIESRENLLGESE